METTAQPTTDEATQKRIDELIKQVGHKDALAREFAAEELGQIGQSAVQPLTKALEDEEKFVRRFADKALVLIGSKLTPEELVKAAAKAVEEWTKAAEAGKAKQAKIEAEQVKDETMEEAEEEQAKAVEEQVKAEVKEKK